MYKKLFTVLMLLILVKTYSQNHPSIPTLLLRIDTAKDTEKIIIYNQIASFYLFQEKNDSALYYTNLSLLLSEKTGNEKEIADTYNQLGIIYRLNSNNEKAMGFYLKALKIYEKNNLYRKAARTLGNISIIFSDELKHDQALENVFRAVTYGLKAKDSITLISLYGSICYDYIQIKNLPKAKEYITKATELLKYELANPKLSPRDSAEVMYQKTNLNYMKATLCTEEGNYQDAISIYKEELKGSGNPLGASSNIDALKGLAENYYRIKQYDAALKYTNEALIQLMKDSIPYFYMDVYSQRSKIFAGMNRFKEAYKAHMLFKGISDSILNKENFRSISNLKINYETEKKEQEINVLNQKRKTQQIITWLAFGAFTIALGFLTLVYRSRKLQQKLYKQKTKTEAKERQIEKNELEKKMTELEQMALRAQMNPHFIFNSLNSVQHFVMNKDVEGVNKYLGAFAHLIRQTLNNSGRQFVTLDEEVKYLDTYLSLEKMKSNNGFNYTIDVSGAIDRSATFIPGMILQPFVENSIKHGVAHKENKDGRINISISKNGKLVCQIEDNGIGRQKAGEIKLSAPSSEFESKGMSITMSRIDTINKIYGVAISARVEDVLGESGTIAGTRVVVYFPADLE
jgi:tetratricopeptide (TPR) repeat protein